METESWRNEPIRLNSYTCRKCSAVTTTVDVDEGVTPFMITCPRCRGGHAISSGYPPERPVPMHVPEPTYEWYKKSEDEVEDYERSHHEMGGLFLRPRTDREGVRNDKG